MSDSSVSIPRAILLLVVILLVVVLVGYGIYAGLTALRVPSKTATVVSVLFVLLVGGGILAFTTR